MKSLFLALVFFAGCGVAIAAAPATIPHLEQRGAARQLIVDGQPYLVLGAELHNSSSTSRSYLQPIWPRLAEYNINTVLAAVPWDVVEPVEGKFDFTLLDQLIEDGRAHQLRLVLLWFGSWKNGFSHYVPEWVKRDPARFPYARIRSGAVEILSLFNEASVTADAKAFTALMRHLRSVDEQQRTVLMVQVENEVGLHGDARDRRPAADAAFAQPVPSELLQFLAAHRDTLLPEFRALWQSAGFKTSGSWAEVFGQSPAAEEAFMGWHYARYVDRIAAAGKAEYPLPLFVNAWIVQAADKLPGDYPSGGPQAHMLDLWRAGAPHIDLLAPDIYRTEFAEICAQFTRAGNTLFVPESRSGQIGAANAFLAFGRFSSIGYSPFGIDGGAESSHLPIRDAYEILGQITPQIQEGQARQSIAAVALDQQTSAEKLQLGGYLLRAAIMPDRATGKVPERAYGLILATGPDEFLVAGCHLQLSFSPASPSDETVGLATVEEGRFEKGTWVPGRRLNGDEITLSIDVAALAAAHQSGTGLRFPTDQPSLIRVKLYRYR